jgi:monovalent cation:H+ antiporter-2, CPA2 family
MLAALGLVLLLFHLGVEFPLQQVLDSGRRIVLAGAAYIAANVTGGLLVGFALGWGTPEALVIAGALGISSSAIVTKLLVELRRLANAETPVLLGIIVVEDIFLALYLALLQPILSGADSAGAMLVDFVVSFGFLLGLFLLARFGARLIGALITSAENELLTLLFFGLAVAVAGAAEGLGVSDAIGALMIGLVISQTPLRERVERQALPLRDVFAALFFTVFGATVDLGALDAVVVPVLLAIVVTVAINVAIGVVVARMYGFNQRAAANLGLTLLGRGEFSLILAALAAAAGLDTRIGPFVALYVLLLAVLSPILAARAHGLARWLPDRLMGSGWEYVRTETMSSNCGHLDDLVVREPTTPGGCPACLAAGDPWVQLRSCLVCGQVGCCDDSTNRHATAHFQETGHPLIRTIEPGEDWIYCYVDEVLVHAPDASAPQD